MASGHPTSGHIYRDALRLLFILVRGSAALPTPEGKWDRVFQGEKRALAIDFWLRYPDYLADKLLDLHEEGTDPRWLAAARRIFEENEPDIRIVKMIRWRRGAFEDLQTSLAVLSYRGLARPIKSPLPGGKFQYEYWTGLQAREFLREAVNDQPILSWYERQVTLALAVAEGKSGSALKDIHYADHEYASTPYGAPIPPIKDRVLGRLEAIDGKEFASGI